MICQPPQITFPRSVRIEPRESYLLGQYAQALFFAESNSLPSRLLQRLDNAFAVDSSNQTVLGLKGIQAFESKDYKLAITFWQGAAQQLDPASSDWQALQSGIQKARNLMGDTAAGAIGDCSEHRQEIFSSLQIN